MIRTLRVCDSDDFIDILHDAFTRELHHLGKGYGYNKREVKLIYFLSRVLQTFYGDVRDVPHILAYYDDRGFVMGISKILPANARKDHWFSEMTAVRKTVQQKGVGTALKQYTVSTYGKKARRLFGNVREENTRMIKVNQRVGYEPYIRKSLFTRSPLSQEIIQQEEGEIEGFRPFCNDQQSVFELYVRRTPHDIREIEDRTPEDFTYGTAMSLQVFLRRLTGKRDKKFIIERDGKVCCYLRFEHLWSTYENLHILMDPHQAGLSRQVVDAIRHLSPGSHIISYLPDFRGVERTTLIKAGFSKKEVYIGMVLKCGG